MRRRRSDNFYKIWIWWPMAVVTTLVAFENCGGFGTQLSNLSGVSSAGSNNGTNDGNGNGNEPNSLAPNVSTVLDAFPQGPNSIKSICSRPEVNVVTKAFCGSNPPTITSLVELQTALGLVFPNRTGPRPAEIFTFSGNSGFVLSGHSSSLVLRSVSAINPRAIITTPNPTVDSAKAQPLPMVIMGYVRGEELAELIANDDVTGQMDFYLFQSKKACDLTQTCTNFDLLTPQVEKNWISYSIFQDHDLKNTILDCLECHQPAGPGTTKILRMQERFDPWTHFFRGDKPGGQALFADFFAAHGHNEDYAGIPAGLLNSSEPFELQCLNEEFGMGNQLNQFTTGQIESEVENSAPGQPSSNATPGQSTTWNAIFNNFLQGTAINVPYHDTKITDPGKLRTMSNAYAAVMAGQLPPDQLPDIRQVFPDDPALLSQMSIRPVPGSTGDKMLVNMCAQCHNSNLDQTISRAKFNAMNLAQMSQDERNVAVARINQPADSLLLMPPVRYRELSADEKQVLSSYIGGNAVPTPTPSPTATPNPNPLGAQLYQTNCAACHNPLANSTRLGRTAAQITTALQTIPAMQGIQLTPAEIQSISDALNGK